MTDGNDSTRVPRLAPARRGIEIREVARGFGIVLVADGGGHRAYLGEALRKNRNAKRRACVS